VRVIHRKKGMALKERLRERKLVGLGTIKGSGW